MTATVVVKELNGAGPTATTITQGRYCTKDAYDPGSDDPCVVPAADFSWSYWKSTEIAWSGTYTQISNIRWFTSGNVASNWALGTGGKLMVGIRDAGDNGCPRVSYEQAAGDQGVTGYDIDDAVNGHDYYKDQTAPPADADGYTSAAPLTVDTAVYTVDGYSDHVVTQLKIASDATQGDKPNETLTWRYDEI